MHSRHHDCRAAAEAFLAVFCAVAELDMNSWREVLQSNLVDNIRNFLPSSSSLLMSSGRSLVVAAGADAHERHVGRGVRS